MVMTKGELQKEIFKALKKAYPKTGVKSEDIEVEIPNNSDHGDFATNVALKAAPELNLESRPMAEKLIERIKIQNCFVKVAGPGFINFYFQKKYYQEQLKEILKAKSAFGSSDLYKNQKVQVEFISANPTGPLTLANGRGGFAGDVLANCFKKAGAKVQREYYINDGGNQVRVLGKSILVTLGLIGDEEDIYRGEYIAEWAKQNKAKILRYKKDPFSLGRIVAKDILIKHIKKTVKLMGVSYDKWFSEYEMIKKKEVEKAIDFFKRERLTVKKEGALWLKTEKFGDDKNRVLIKKDGDKTYFANDVAYHWDKYKKRKFDKVVNIWGADHHGYIGRMRAAVSAMGCGEKLDIILTQWVRLIKEGKEFSISKRKGTYITVDDLLTQINKRNKREASDVARFLFLTKSFNTHMDFDLGIAQEKEAQKNPVYYVKYAYARIHGILAKSKLKNQNSKIKFELLTHPAEINLIKELVRFPQVIEEIVGSRFYPVNKLTFYAIDIATKFHLFYDKCRVIDSNNKELTRARLKLVEAVKIVLGVLMKDLIGIDTPKKM